MGMVFSRHECHNVELRMCYQSRKMAVEDLNNSYSHVCRSP